MSEYSQGHSQGPHAYGAMRPHYNHDAFRQQGQQPYASSSYNHQQQPGYAPSSYTHAPSSYSTFPAPRRASNQALVPPVGESTIAPAISHRHAPIDPRHHDEVPKHKHRHAPSVDDWDTRSDSSYYARPKGTRSHSGSSLSDITTDPRVVHHHHHHHHHHTPKGSPGLHGHSPSSPSPLARDRELGRSPLSPRSHIVHQEKGRKISALGTGSDQGPDSPYKPITPITGGRNYSPVGLENDRDLRTVHEGHEKRYRHHSASFDGCHKPKSQLGQGYTSDDESRHSHRGRSQYGDESLRNGSRSRKPKYRAEAYLHGGEFDDDDTPRQGQGRDHSRQHHDHPENGTRSKHHRPRSHSHVPPPLPYRSHSPVQGQGHGHAQGQSLQVPHQHSHSQQLMPDMAALSLGDGRRPRARSMQYTPSPGSLAGYGTGGGGGGLAPPSGGGYGSLAGFGGGGLAPPSMNGGMGMGMGGSMRDGGAGVLGGYDDAGSVAGSAMTFMDGASRGGLTSQYGLPKYPHQAKPDPRRSDLSPFPRLPLRRPSARADS